MDDLISVTNQLRDLLGGLENKQLVLSLPLIVVVGDEASGKSSVIEAIVGREFLPRGPGIVTRCPLIVQLTNREGQEFWNFDHIPGKVFNDTKAVRAEIQRKTSEVASCPQGVTDTPIMLRLFSPRVKDFALMNLPGLMTTATEWQPLEITEVIGNMILERIRNDNVLILAVSLANQDMDTSAALKIAGQADPQFHRTIGVLTGLDTVETGQESHVLNLLNGKVLKHGFIGLFNQAQKDGGDINQNESVHAKEKELLNKKPWLKPVMNRIGTKSLQHILRELLNEHISLSIPGIKLLIESCLAESKFELEHFGDMAEDEISLMARCGALVDKLKQCLGQALQGADENSCNTNVSVGFKIRRELDGFCEHLNKMDFDEKKVKKELYMKVRSMRGLTAGIVPPDLVVTYITKQYIGKLVDPIKDTMRAVDDIMQQLIKELIKVCSGYPTLMVASMRAMKKQLRQCIDKTHRRVEEFCDEDKVFIETAKLDIALSMSMGKAAKAERREEGKAETVPQISIDKLYEAFLYLMNISKKKYQEHIRKIICFNTIVGFQKYVETGMFHDVLKCEGDVKKLMARSLDSQARIANLKAEVDACSKALELIDNLVIY